jgi:hypothetical protein
LCDSRIEPMKVKIYSSEGLKKLANHGASVM